MFTPGVNVVCVCVTVFSPWWRRRTASRTSVRSAGCRRSQFWPRCKTPPTGSWTTNSKSPVNWDQCPYWGERERIRESMTKGATENQIKPKKVFRRILKVSGVYSEVLYNHILIKCCDNNFYNFLFRPAGSMPQSLRVEAETRIFP